MQGSWVQIPSPCFHTYPKLPCRIATIPSHTSSHHCCITHHFSETTMSMCHKSIPCFPHIIVVPYITSLEQHVNVPHTSLLYHTRHFPETTCHIDMNFIMVSKYMAHPPHLHSKGALLPWIHLTVPMGATPLRLLMTPSQSFASWSLRVTCSRSLAPIHTP